MSQRDWGRRAVPPRTHLGRHPVDYRDSHSGDRSQVTPATDPRSRRSFEAYWFLIGWALVELVEAAVRSGVPERAAGALQRLSGIARACGTDWILGAEAR